MQSTPRAEGRIQALARPQLVGLSVLGQVQVPRPAFLRAQEALSPPPRGRVLWGLQQAQELEALPASLSWLP